MATDNFSTTQMERLYDAQACLNGIAGMLDESAQNDAVRLLIMAKQLIGETINEIDQQDLALSSALRGAAATPCQ